MVDAIGDMLDSAISGAKPPSAPVAAPQAAPASADPVGDMLDVAISGKQQSAPVKDTSSSATDLGAQFGAGASKGLIAKGLGGPVDLASAFLNYEHRKWYGDNESPFGGENTFGSSDWIAKKFLPTPPEPKNEGERLINLFGQGAGEAVGMAGAAKAAKAANLVSPKTAETMEHITGQPTDKLNAVIGGTAAVAGDVAANQQVIPIPEKYKPIVATIAGAGAGLGVAAPYVVAKSAGAGLRGIKETVTRSGNELKVGREMNAAADSVKPEDVPPGYIATNDINGAATPGVDLTTAQQSGNMGLAGWERKVRQENPVPFQAREQAQNEALTRQMGSVQPTGDVASIPGTIEAQRNAAAAAAKQAETDFAATSQSHVDAAEAAHAAAVNDLRSVGPTASPSELSNHFRSVRNSLDAMTLANVKEATGKAESAAGEVAPRLTEPEQVGEAIRTPVAERHQQASDTIDKMYSELDKKGNLKIPSISISKTAMETLRKIPAEADPQTAREKRLFDNALEYGADTPLTNIRALRSGILKEMAATKNRNSEAFNRLNLLRAAVDDSLDHAAEVQFATDKIALERGAMAPEDALSSRMDKVLNEHPTQGQAATAANANEVGAGAGQRPSRGARKAGAKGTTDERPGDVAGSEGVPGGSGAQEGSLGAKGEELRQHLENTGWKVKRASDMEGTKGVTYSHPDAPRHEVTVLARPNGEVSWAYSGPKAPGPWKGGGRALTTNKTGDLDALKTKLKGVVPETKVESEAVKGAAEIDAKGNVNRSHDVPYLAGSSKDGKTVYIDSRVPTTLKVRVNGSIRGKLREIDPAKYLEVHERVEHDLMTKKGMSYEDAHERANAEEKRAVEADGLNHADYQKKIMKYAPKTEREKVENPPPDLFTKGVYPKAKTKELEQKGGAPSNVKEFPETIASTAVKIDGKVYGGGVHHFQDLERAMRESGLSEEEVFKHFDKDENQGFLTNTGRYVDRVEAEKIANKTHGTKISDRPDYFLPSEETGVPPGLFSEDLGKKPGYPEPLKSGAKADKARTPEQEAAADTLAEKYYERGARKRAIKEETAKASNENVPERVEGATIKLGDKVFKGPSHPEIYEANEKEFDRLDREAQKSGKNLPWDQGFSTNLRSHISREEASKLVKEEGGLLTDRIKNSTSLKSEDLTHLRNLTPEAIKNIEETGMTPSEEVMKAKIAKRIEIRRIQEGQTTREEEAFKRLAQKAQGDKKLQAIVAKLREANAAHREMRELFHEGPVGEILAKKPEGEGYELSDAQVASKIFKPGDTGGESIKSFLKAADTKESRQALTDAATFSFDKAAMRNGVIDPKLADKWLRDHAPAIRELPEDIKSKFDTASKAQKAVEEANAARKDQLDSFDKSEFAKIAKLDADQDVVAHMGQVLASKDAATRLSELNKATKGNIEASRGMRRAILESVFNKLLPDTGKVGDFFDKNNEALSKVFTSKELTAIRTRVEAAQQAKENINTTKTAQQTGMKAAAEQTKAATSEYEKGILARLMKVEGKGNVIDTLGSIFSGDNSTKEMAALMDKAKNVEGGVDAVRKGVQEMLSRDFTRSVNSGTSETPEIARNQLAKFFKENTDALERVFTPEQVGKIRAIITDMHKINRTINAVKLKGGPGTAQDLIQAAKSNSHAGGSTLDALAFIVGEHLHGAVTGVLGAAGTHLWGALKAAGLSRMNQIRVEAALDPEFATKLMERARNAPNKNTLALITLRLRQLALNAAIAGKDQETPHK